MPIECYTLQNDKLNDSDLILMDMVRNIIAGELLFKKQKNNKQKKTKVMNKIRDDQSLAKVLGRTAHSRIHVMFKDTPNLIT